MYNECSKIVKSFLLYQNPLYSFSFPISLIVGIIVYGICVSMKLTSNSYLLQIIIPIVTIIFVNILIEYISSMHIDKQELDHLTELCLSYIQKQNKEHFTQEEKEQEQDQEHSQVQSPVSLESKPLTQELDQIQQEKELRAPLNIIDNLYNSTYEIINKDTSLYALPYDGLTSQNLCKIE
jgi:hypothetical protein